LDIIDGIQLKEDKRIIELVKDIAEYFEMEAGKKLSASQFLDRFMFPPAMQYQYVSSLSGGEKRRLYLLTILIKNPNFLILDEPTNDLDIFTMNVLEEYLASYKGCLIVVSHDRYFMDKIVDHLFVFKGNAEVHDFNGSYSLWREEEENEATQKEQSKYSKVIAPDIEKPKKEVPKTKLNFNQKREFEQLEKELEQLESKKSELESALSSGTLSNDEILHASSEIAAIISTLEKKTDRWLELSEFEQ
jgi:ABC transport system ATP-binding/permease protein